jgi:threonine dehydrogenase-like Zn-dependent dehydrogenase
VPANVQQQVCKKNRDGGYFLTRIIAGFADMKALLFNGSALTLRADYPRPVRKPGEALIAVAVAGICNTDVEISRGYMDFRGVPGHEFVGVVEEADDSSLVGRRVGGEINCPCGDCDLCRRGLGRHCRSRTTLGISGRDGVFAEHTTLPEANLHVVPDGMSDETAVFTEPVAAAFSILEQVTPEHPNRCLVMGDGKLGLLIAQVLSPLCRTTLLGRHAAKLAVAREFGIETAEPNGFDGRDFDLVVEATGSREGLDAAMGFVRPRGKIVLKTTVDGEIPVPLWRVVVDEIQLIGSRCGLFRPAVDALASGAVKVAPLVKGRYSLDDFEEAFTAATTKGALKVLLYPRGVS